MTDEVPTSSQSRVPAEIMASVQSFVDSITTPGPTVDAGEQQRRREYWLGEEKKREDQLRREIEGLPLNDAVLRFMMSYWVQGRPTFIGEVSIVEFLPDAEPRALAAAAVLVRAFQDRIEEYLDGAVPFEEVRSNHPGFLDWSLKRGLYLVRTVHRP